MPTHLALIALFSLSLPWGGDHGPAAARHFGGWTLIARTDSFTTGHICKLSRRDIDYQRGVVVLHLSPRIDTTEAVFRVDDGPPLLARADDARIARLGFALRNDDLDNPSGGLVRVPADRLLGAHAVRVETRAFTRPAAFTIDGLDAALNAAKASGCAADDFR